MIYRAFHFLRLTVLRMFNLYFTLIFMVSNMFPMYMIIQCLWHRCYIHVEWITYNCCLLIFVFVCLRERERERERDNIHILGFFALKKKKGFFAFACMDVRLCVYMHRDARKQEEGEKGLISCTTCSGLIVVWLYRNMVQENGNFLKFNTYAV